MVPDGTLCNKRLDDAFLCPDFVFMQGVEIGRPSLILCCTIDEINVLGMVDESGRPVETSSFRLWFGLLLPWRTRMEGTERR